jgi:hypothetical protein
MGNLNDLADRLDKINAGINKAASDIAVKVAETIVADLAFHTPVDTSKALSNWRVSLNTPISGNIGPHYPGKFGSSQKLSAQETIAEARLILKVKLPGEKIYITNNLPYIQLLNDGTHSKQPGAFVERALLLGRKISKETKLKVIK